MRSGSIAVPRIRICTPALEIFWIFRMRRRCSLADICRCVTHRAWRHRERSRSGHLVLFQFFDGRMSLIFEHHRARKGLTSRERMLAVALMTVVAVVGIAAATATATTTDCDTTDYDNDRRDTTDADNDRQRPTTTVVEKCGGGAQRRLASEWESKRAGSVRLELLCIISD